MKFYAHTREDGQYQMVSEHLHGVADRSMHYAEAFSAGYLGYLAGILHDIGKYSSEFQHRIRGNPISVDHSSAGAQWIMRDQTVRDYLGNTRLDLYLARLIAFAIAFHHGGLKNYGSIDEEGSLNYRIAKETLASWNAAWSEIEICRQDWSAIKKSLVSTWNKDHPAWSYSFLGRMIYSCLVDADSIDTRDFCEVTDNQVSPDRQLPTMADLKNKLDNFLVQKFARTPHTPINDLRGKILAACERQAESEPGIFSLTVPTGGGKTFSSLSFALRHANQYGMQRVIYVIPFTSIIEQNAEQFRIALGHNAVLEHHSSFNYDEYEENYGLNEVRRLKLGTENWDAPVVVTTAVQFFESLFSVQRSKCRKLHNIANSVIILDEVQSTPRGYIGPCLQALKELVHAYHCSVVLCTATQPSWSGLGIHAKEIMDTPTPDELMDAFKRVEVVVYGSQTDVVCDQQIFDWMKDSEQVLCIVNTRKHAKLLYDQIAEQDLEGVYHLSGRLCAKHRSIVITAIRDRLQAQLPCRVISTQLIEAGVDVDFPLVLRAWAGLDSIAQAAGRCNREGRRQSGIVRVFYPEKHGMPSRGWLKETAIETQNTWAYEKEPPLSLICIHTYFERIHGIRDGQVHEITDAKGIMDLLKSKNANFEIPYEDIADRFQLIDGNMQTIVVPFDDVAKHLIEQLPFSNYPMVLLRRLQSYTVQIYQHEFVELQRNHLVKDVEGVHVLTDTSYYHAAAGLLTVTDTPEYEVLIF